MDNDFGRPGNIITSPVTLRTRAGEKVRQPLCPGGEFLLKICTAGNCDPNRSDDWDDFRGFHSAGDANCIVTRFNGKWHRGFIEIGDEKVAISMPLAGLQRNDPLVAL
jgi:hypothetical protein